MQEKFKLSANYFKRKLVFIFFLSEKLKLIINREFNLFSKGTLFNLDVFIIVFLFINLFLFFSVLNTFFDIQENKIISYAKSAVEIHPYPYFVQNEDYNISARAFVVFEKDSRVFVYKKNENFRFSPASSAKIMTAIIALENYHLDDILVAKNIDKVEGSKMNLKEGEKIKIADLLYGLLLSSGNDAAYVLASSMEGGAGEFVKKMNEKAAQLKLTNTFFADASGYEDANYTTASDLARLASYALNNENFANIVKTKTKFLYSSSGNVSHILVNLNELLGEEGVNGVKTGFTNEAGGVLITSIVSNNNTFIIVVLRSDDRFIDTREIISKIVKKTTFFSYE